LKRASKRVSELGDSHHHVEVGVAEYRDGRQAGRLHSLDFAYALVDRGCDLRHVSRQRSPTETVRNVEQKHVFGAKTEVDVAKIAHRPDEQPGANEQRERERHLDQHQRAAQPLPSVTTGAGAALLCHRCNQISSSASERGRDTEADSGEERRPRHEGEHREVRTQIQRAGVSHRCEPARAAVGKHHTRGHTHRGE
jgi:hypothetical protein